MMWLMAYPGRDWHPPFPPPPREKMERITGRRHISDHCALEAIREYTAFLRSEPYTFQIPETDGDGYFPLSQLGKNE